LVKGKGDKQAVAQLKSQPDHFTFYERGFTESCMGQVGIPHIAFQEFAFPENTIIQEAF
jgi:hypothetical protein